MYIAGMEMARLPNQLPRLLTDVIPGLGRGLQRDIAAAFQVTAEEMSKDSRAMLLQVGANDGVFDDPVGGLIDEYGLRALLVEPQEDAFRRLRRRHKRNGKVMLARCAVVEQEGPVSMFTKGHAYERFWSANTTRHPEQLRRVAHWHWLRSYFSGTEIHRFEVQGMTLEGLLKRQEVEADQLAMVVLDTEGDDVMILRQLFDTAADPALIQYEHLRATNEGVRATEKELGARGYQLFTTYKDTVARK